MDNDKLNEPIVLDEEALREVAGGYPGYPGNIVTPPPPGADVTYGSNPLHN